VTRMRCPPRRVYALAARKALVRHRLEQYFGAGPRKGFSNTTPQVRQATGASTTGRGTSTRDRSKAGITLTGPRMNSTIPALTSTPFVSCGS
jgi:hypothetical protein